MPPDCPIEKKGEIGGDEIHPEIRPRSKVIKAEPDGQRNGRVHFLDKREDR